MEINGLQVMTIAPHFAAPPRPSATRGFDLVGLSQSPKYAAFPGRSVVHTLRFDFLCHSNSEIRALVEFFELQKGKWGDFFLPSWHAELTPASDLADNGDELQIEPIGYEDAYFADTSFDNWLGQHIFMLHREGDFHVSKVLSVIGGPAEVLTLASPVERDWNIGDFIIGFLYHVRWLNDELELEFHGLNQASTTLAAQELVPVELLGS